MAIGTLPPELFEQQQQLNRQQQMAQLLMQQGQQQPQGQMISGRYVAPSFTQNLANLANTYVGSRLAEQGDKQALEIAKQLRQRYGDELKEFRNLMQGRPEIAGTPDIPTETYETVRGTPAQAAIPPNVQGAYDFAATAYNPALQAAGLRKLTEGPIKVGVEDTLIDPVTMKPVFTGAGKPRTPLQIDTGTAIELRDPNNPTIVLQRIPKTQMPTAGQVVERDDGTFLIDTRTGQARPVMGQGGEPLMGGGKPLTETQGNAVSFGARAVEANRIATDLEKQGVTNTGVIRTVAGGVLGGAPIVGDKLEQSVRSTFNVLPTYLGGPNPQQQQNDQARRDFVSAVLRKESGAAISASEYANEEKKYFPQLGDSDQVIKQKQNSRIKAIEGLKSQAGPSGVRQINRIVGAEQGGGNVVDFNQLPTGR